MKSIETYIVGKWSLDERREAASSAFSVRSWNLGGPLAAGPLFFDADTERTAKDNPSSTILTPS